MLARVQPEIIVAISAQEAGHMALIQTPKMSRLEMRPITPEKPIGVYEPLGAILQVWCVLNSLAECGGLKVCFWARIQLRRRSRGVIGVQRGEFQRVVYGGNPLQT